MFKFMIIVSLALASQIAAGESDDDARFLEGDERSIADYCKESRDFLAKELNTDHPDNILHHFFVPANKMNTGLLNFKMEASPEDRVAYKTEWFTKACAKVAEYAQILERNLVEAKAKILAQHPEYQSFLNTLTGIDKVNCLTVHTIDTGMVGCRSFAKGTGALTMMLNTDLEPYSH